MRKIVLTFGLISGAILSGLMFLSVAFQDRIGLDHSLVLGYATMVLAFLLIYFGVRSYRDTAGAGRVGFGKAFQVGVLIMLVASVCYVVSWDIVYRNFMPNFFADYSAHVLEQARASGATEAQLAAQQAQLAQYAEMYKNPLIRAGMTFLEPLPVGLLFALLSAWLLSRKKQEAAA
ncbi:MAG TPA: DUF4199 domain-containing protein [Gemmatimonadales bacterium]|nr:DUF4199 domain-containing protein [Gemmatimonadales bacterium]